jgi:hypothetical protein
MIELLRDPAWQFVGAVLALVAVAATVVIYLLQRQRKSLSYDLVSTNQLLTVREEVEGKLQVLYEGQPTRDIQLLVVRLINSGNVAIASSDYERELSIGTGVRSKILSAAVTNVEPDNLIAEVVTEDARVTLKAVLLNPRDTITLKILVSDFENIVVDGRIVGVKEIVNINKLTPYQVLSWALWILLFLFGIYLMVSYDVRPEPTPPTPWQEKAGVALVVLSYVGLFVSLAKSRRFMRTVRRMVLKPRN